MIGRSPAFHSIAEQIQVQVGGGCLPVVVVVVMRKGERTPEVFLRCSKLKLIAAPVILGPPRQPQVKNPQIYFSFLYPYSLTFLGLAINLQPFLDTS